MPARPQQPHPVRAAGGVVEQRRLADARLPRRAPAPRWRRSAPAPAPGRSPAAHAPAPAAWRDCRRHLVRRARRPRRTRGVPGSERGPAAPTFAETRPEEDIMSTTEQPPQLDERQADAVRVPRRRRGRRDPQRRAGRDGRQARLLPGAGRRGPADPGRAGRPHRHRRAVRPRVAERAGRGRLRRATTRTPAATPCRPSRRSR